MPRPPGPDGIVNPSRIVRMKAMRDAGMSYRAIRTAVEVYEGRAPCERTIRTILRRLGCPPRPRGDSYVRNFGGER